MALLKDIEIKNSGLVANYIAIDSVISMRDLQTNTFSTTICFALYKDQAARQNGKAPIDTHSVVVNDIAFVESIIALSYSKLKEIVTGAIDA